MHPGDRELLTELSCTYPNHFVSSRVLELGSLNISGTVRDYFDDKVEYVGIDIVAGPDVDIVVAAKNTVFNKDQFDTLISMSMAEHDPEWQESLAHNFQWLRAGGLFVLSWGAEGNRHHAPEPWKIVPFKEMKSFLETQPLRDLDVFMEATRYSEVGGVGAAVAVGFKV
jgi:SAM-dependent methyltransferase